MANKGLFQRPVELALLLGVFVWCFFFSTWCRRLLADDHGGRNTLMYPPMLSAARRIVDKAYHESYAIFQSCPLDQDFMSCIMERRHDSYNNSWPWWFQTMLRDAVPKSKPKSNLFGAWHEINISDPPLQICSIEKVGTKEWRKLSCLINEQVHNVSSFGGDGCFVPEGKVSAFEKGFDKVVFLRDPLERFLSGWLDKCWKTWDIDEHCEPREMYRDSRLIKGLVKDKQKFFEAFVDTMPMSWNVHFFPQSLYCGGLFRGVQQYDFVGHMGPAFYNDLQQLSAKYDNSSFEDALEEVFAYKTRRRLGHEYHGIEKNAVSKVEAIYTPRSLRRVLEYVSIDYVLLSMPIPTWAQRMLEDDEEKGHNTFMGTKAIERR